MIRKLEKYLEDKRKELRGLARAIKTSLIKLFLLF